MRFFTVTALVLCLVLPVFSVFPARADNNDPAKQAADFVDNVARQAMETISKKQSGELTENQAKQTFRKILTDSFDLPTIARFTMGRYWRVATPEQQKEYTELLRTKILDQYADSILSYSGNGYKTGNGKMLNDKDAGVDMVIDRAGQAPIDFGWRLRRFGKNFKVIDISVEGISMSVTHRSDFASVIERNGGKVQALIDALKNKKSEILTDPVKAR